MTANTKTAAAGYRPEHPQQNLAGSSSLQPGYLYSDDEYFIVFQVLF